MEIVVLLAAELDVQTAFNRFEEYREGLGVTFLQELDVAYEYLQRHPRIGRLYAEDRRRFLVPNFPFGIFYSIIACCLLPVYVSISYFAKLTKLGACATSLNRAERVPLFHLRRWLADPQRFSPWGGLREVS